MRVRTTIYTPEQLRARIEKNSIPEPNSGCWLWTLCASPRGYGRLGPLRKYGDQLAHRLSYRAFRGDFDVALCVLHKCDTPPCVNPDHLFLGTRRDNLEDMTSKGRRAIGARNGAAKLTDELVRKVRLLRAEGWTHERIAAAMGVSRRAIGVVASGEAWRHVQ